MTIDLDVLMRLGQIALIVAGVIVLIYIVLFLKSLMTTFTSLQKTLDALTNDLVRLETPLQTVGELSASVEQIQGSAKKAAMSAINVFSQSTDKVSDLLKSKKNGGQAAVQKDSAETRAEVKEDFQKIEKSINSLDEKIEEKQQGDNTPEGEEENAGK